MDTDEEEEEVPTLVSIDADEKDEEVAFFPVDKMLHEQVHDFLEVCEEYFGIATDWASTGTLLPLCAALSVSGDESDQVRDENQLLISSSDGSGCGLGSSLFYWKMKWVFSIVNLPTKNMFRTISDNCSCGQVGKDTRGGHRQTGAFESKAKLSKSFPDLQNGRHGLVGADCRFLVGGGLGRVDGISIKRNPYFLEVDKCHQTSSFPQHDHHQIVAFS